MAVSDQGSNIEAIADFFGRESPRTSAARAVKNEWQVFYSGLGDWEKNFEQQAYDRARNLRLKYNRANATTDAERAAVEAQALTGLTSEQIAGQADRRQTDGTFVPPPSASDELKHIAIGVGVAAVAVLFLARR